MFNSELLQNPGGGGVFYNHLINHSVRFEEDAGDKLTRTPSSSGNRRTFAISFWLKRTVLSNSGNHMVVFGADPNNGGSSYFHLRLDNTDRFHISSSGSFGWITTAKFRDISAWSHFYIGIDTNATGQDNQVKIYHNGVRITAFDQKNGPQASFQTNVNHTLEHQFGVLAYGGNSTDFAGYLAEFYLIDGNQQAHTDFGEFKADPDGNNIWIPKDASGLTFGTNGIHFKWQNASALGDDSSGNNNDYSVTSMPVDRQVLDSPTSGS